MPAAGKRLGVDATLDGVRWTEIRDRIFGRIDPISAGGRDYRQHHPDNANVTVYEGTARFTGPRELEIDGARITADRIVLAAGARPVELDVPGLDEVGFYTSNTIMRIDALPRHLTIIGSGFVSAEFAHVFSSFGVEVTVIARSDALLRHEDSDISERFTSLAKEKWDVRLERKVLRASRAEGRIQLDLDGDVVNTDLVLVAIGRTPNSDLLNLKAAGIEVTETGHVVVDPCQSTTAEGVWALGDISSPIELKHVANHEARVVQHNLLNPDSLMDADHRFVPHAVFTSPQIASVGVTEEQAQEQGLDYVTAKQDYAGIAYGWAMEDTTGFAKLLADPVSGQLLGAHIIGPQASTLIQPLIQAMSFGLNARSMAGGQYWIHPAMPELIENALLNLPL
jgi:mycothione reductase